MTRCTRGCGGSVGAVMAWVQFNMIGKCSNYGSKLASCKALLELRIKKMLQASKKFCPLR
jgi:hypothetical protein